MVAVTEIIQNSLRESNILGAGVSPTGTELDEAVNEYNDLIFNLLGHEIGQETMDWPVGGTPKEAIYGDTWTEAQWSLPIPNSRLIVSVGTTQNIKLPQDPDNGCMIEVVNATSTSIQVILEGNGRLIDNATSYSITGLVTNPIRLFYRANEGQWMIFPNSFSATDDHPFPSQYNIFFQTALAARLNPRYGREMPPLVEAAFKDALLKLKKDYQQPKTVTTSRPVSIITEALRGSGRIDQDEYPSAGELEAGLKDLYSVLQNLLGFELGGPFYEKNINKDTELNKKIDISRSGKSYRFNCNLLRDSVLCLPSVPKNGSRLSIIDSRNSFGTYSLTLDANERAIDGLDTIVLNEDGTVKEWFYRADLGQWLEVRQPHILSDLPIPAKYDRLLTYMLVEFLGGELTQGEAATVRTLRRRMRAEYAETIETGSELALLITSASDWNRGNYWSKNDLWDFNKGTSRWY